jgi:MYXO-CTERM domain-containing protein
LLLVATIMKPACDSTQLSPTATLFARFRLHTALSALAVISGCASAASDDANSDEQVAEVTPDAVKTVQSYVTSTSCSTAVVMGLSKQISDEITCMDPTGLVKFAAGSGITITSNAVLPYLAANAKADLQKVGSVQVNSAFRTIASQYLLVQWFDRHECGITAAAPVGSSNHESGRAVDLENWSARVSAMAAHGWAHDVPGDSVHFDHLSSKDISGKDTLAFQKLWNLNHPTEKLVEDGEYGPNTEARLKSSPAAGFAKGPSCAAISAKVAAELVSAEGPDKIAPGATAHYTLTITNNTDTDWPATLQLTAAGVADDGTVGGPSALYDAASWVSATQVGTLGTAIPAGGQGTIDVDVVGPDVTASTAVNTQLTLTDGTNALATVPLAVTVTPDGDENTSSESDDPSDPADPAAPAAPTGATGATANSGGCSVGGSADGAALLGLGVLGLVLRRRRR